MRIMFRLVERPAHVMPGNCASKARTMSSPMATSCISASTIEGHCSWSARRRYTKLMSGALIADRAEMLIDAKDDQDEFGRDAREDNADDDAGDRGQQLYETSERADGHRRQAGENAGDSEQSDERDGQPVKGLDDRGGNKAVPLKQILKIQHRCFSRQCPTELPHEADH